MKQTLDPFIIGLLGAIALAFGCSLGEFDINLNQLSSIAKYGIAGIFFFYGLKINTSTLKNDLGNWKLHLLVQSSTFLLFPLLVAPFYFIAVDTAWFYSWLAIYFLACLPSTVSSSVVMVSIANGNIPAAIFNASISGLIGVIITPTLLSLFLSQTGSSVEVSSFISGICLQVLIPVLLGLILQKHFGQWAQRHKTKLSTFDKLIILLIVFKSFYFSFKEGTFNSVSTLQLTTIFTIAIALFVISYYILLWFTKLTKLKVKDQTVVLFCGSKKSLIHGSVFLSLLFPDFENAGLLLLPVMLYHAFQLVAVSFIAHKRSNM